MPETNILMNAYTRLSSIRDIHLEPFDIISTVEQYRNFWKPEHIKVILLAESYVYTSLADYYLSLNPKLISDLKLSDYPKKYVRFVYCLGYGEDEILIGKVNKNSGTPQFWKIFYSCLHPILTNEDFIPILKNGTNFEERIKNKARLLQELKAKGIWLLDASLMALYGKDDSLSNTKKEQIITTCWNDYIKKAIVENHPKKVICIGRGVENALDCEFAQLKRSEMIEVIVIPQPQAHLSSSDHIRNFQRYYEICNNKIS